MTETHLIAVALSALAGILAGRAWAAALRRGGLGPRPQAQLTLRYVQGLQYLAGGQIERAIPELLRVVRSDPDAIAVALLLGNLHREIGRVERAIKVHKGLLERLELSRAERAHVLACLGMDYRDAGFVDRSLRTFEEVLDLDPKNVHALLGLQRLHEDQQRWQDALFIHRRLARLQRSDRGAEQAYLQTEIGNDAARVGDTAAAEKAYQAAIGSHPQVFPAYLGLADLYLQTDAGKAVHSLERALAARPDLAYLTFDRLARAYAASSEPERFVSLCERLIHEDPRDWRARLALAKHLRRAERPQEAFGLLLRAVEGNPQALALHIELWRTLNDLGVRHPASDEYVALAESSVFYTDPHLCTRCRYRADDMLWRCPHCHAWGTFVEERVAPSATGRG
jgi:lipopolysaccharide assembly protein B